MTIRTGSTAGGTRASGVPPTGGPDSGGRRKVADVAVYAGFAIAPFEREPGLWRAVVRRDEATTPTRAGADLAAFTTSADAPSREDAIRLAQAAIDAGLAC